MRVSADEVQPIPLGVLDFCRAAKLGDITTIETLQGGVISLTRRLITSKHASMIVKQSAQAPVQIPADLYACEAHSLSVLKAAGLRTPEVLAMDADFLLLEDLGSVQLDAISWEKAGRAIAHLHQHTHAQFGFAQDNYLGMLPQYNAWAGDGHAFFAQKRLLRYLAVPLCEQTLTPQDRQDLERLAARLPQLIPMQPASLLHGDLWVANVTASRDGSPAFLDPAVYYGWAEAELSMMRQYKGVPKVFFDAYVEVNPLNEGWWERLELLYLREILSVIAHFGNRHDALGQLRAIIAKFS